MDELGGPRKISRNVAVWQIIHMETIILNTMACVLGRIDPNMVLSSVQHMGHTKALEVGNVTHRLSIPNDDAWKHLVTADRPPFLSLLGWLAPRKTPTISDMVVVALFKVTHR